MRKNVLLVNSHSKEKVVKVLENANRPLAIKEIAKLSSIGWSTARNALTELALTEKVSGFRVGNSLFFQLLHDVDVRVKNGKLVFSTELYGKTKKATLPIKDVHAYLQKPDSKIEQNFKKVFGVKVNVDKLRKEIAKLSGQGVVVEE